MKKPTGGVLQFVNRAFPQAKDRLLQRPMQRDEREGVSIYLESVVLSLVALLGLLRLSTETVLPRVGPLEGRKLLRSERFGYKPPLT